MTAAIHQPERTSVGYRQTPGACTTRLSLKSLHTRQWLAAITVLTVMICCTGCAAQRALREADRAVARGDYEQGLSTLELATRRDPEDVQLRSALVRMRVDIVARALARVAELRSKGQFAAATQELERAIKADPRQTRLRELAQDIEVDTRQQQTLQDVTHLVAAGKTHDAVRRIDESLKDNTRQPDLLQARRKIEAALRAEELGQGIQTLAETRPLSLDFREANLRTVLDVVTRNSGINFVIDRDVRQDLRTTVLLKEVSVQDALDLITSTNKLALKVIDKKSVLIYPNTSDKQREYQEHVVRVFHLASADAKGAAAFLRAMLRVREPYVDERANMLALRETPENIQLAERLIALYDGGEPEVLMEVEVMEISTTRLNELGIKYPDTMSLTPLAPLGASQLTLANIGQVGRDRIAVGVSGLLINLRREVGDFNTLANPRIRARNKEKARILIGDKIPVVTTTTAGTGFVSESVNYLDVGVKLEVEPTVYPDDEVAIRVSLEVSSLGTAVKTTSGTLAYQIGTRSASTLLRLRDSETQLLAGLISRDERTNSSRIPGLGDLPILGRLFSNQQDSSQRTELVLAITPRILRNIHRPVASEAELWVGTEALPRMRPVGGMKFANTEKTDSANTDPPSAANQGNTYKSTQRDVALDGMKNVELPAGAADSQSAQQPATTLAWGKVPDVKLGDVFELDLHLRTKYRIRGVPLTLKFDQRRLELIKIASGGYMGKQDAAVSLTESPDPSSGTVSLGLLNTQGADPSSDPLLKFKFKAIAEGNAALVVQGAAITGMGLSPPPPQLPPPLELEITR